MNDTITAAAAYGPQPTFAKPCECIRPEPVEDSDHTCPFCGRQVAGQAIPTKGRAKSPELFRAERRETGHKRLRYPGLA